MSEAPLGFVTSRMYVEAVADESVPFPETANVQLNAGGPMAQYPNGPLHALAGQSETFAGALEVQERPIDPVVEVDREIASGQTV